MPDQLACGSGAPCDGVLRPVAKQTGGFATLSLVEATAEDLERVFLTRSASFARALFAVTGDRDAAADAVQDAFAAALASRASFRGGSLEAWVWRIAIRSAGRRARRAAREISSEHVDVLISTRAESDPELRDAVAKLASQRRLVVFLRYWAGLSYAEIAELRGVSVGSVSATLAQAHEELRALIIEREVRS